MVYCPGEKDGKSLRVSRKKETIKIAGVVKPPLLKVLGILPVFSCAIWKQIRAKDQLLFESAGHEKVCQTNILIWGEDEIL